MPVVLIEKQSPQITVITLNRPERRNALTIELMTELTAAIENSAADPRQRIVILRGAGKAFCTGLDLEEAAKADPHATAEMAARMLLAARNPVLWAGQGVIYAEAGDRLAALAEMIPAPVVATNPGKSAIPDSHPLSLGGSTRSRSKGFAHFMAHADVVLAIGSSLTKTSFGPAVPKGKTIIHVRP